MGIEGRGTRNGRGMRENKREEAEYVSCTLGLGPVEIAHGLHRALRTDHLPHQR